MKRIKVIIWGIAVIMLGITLFVVLGKENSTDKPKYTTYTVKTENTRYFNGVVQEDQKQAVSQDVKSADETLVASYVNSGDPVTKGETLFSFYNDMTSEINGVNLEIKQAQLTIQELNKTTDKNTDYQIELAKDQEALNDAQDKLNKLNKEQNRVVTAPINGTYYESAGHSYIYGSPIIVGNVNEFSVDKIKLGKEVSVIKNNGKKITGSYTKKDSIPYNNGAVSYYHFQVSTDEELPYGMHVQIKNQSKGYKIPEAAVKSGDTVYLVRNGKKHERILNLTKSGHYYYAKEGIKAGDKLVLF
ncbi:hypothetical protein M5C72_00540 [Companilactobacillus allii]|uniref:Uncharacterized protein n=1 Tax=Companilactobacillus allii TaxID=1847728 RepID=A0A1P8Q1H3_9LACO|nr:hypothetical protein [Companilactobacillus allii]APX71671.1 hypothetical protein BTM29_03465 [Companilactobacillus allii]USQ68756.1 hypothetical protein M5C72_00540 [Companilactobacillus allii]